MTRFQEPLLASGGGITLGPQGRTFSARFAACRVALGTGPEPMAARWEWISVGLPGTGPGATVALVVRGSVTTDEDARATVVVVVDGTPSAVPFGPLEDQRIDVPLVWESFGRDKALPLAVGVLVERAAGTRGRATLAISAVEGEMGPPPV